eukprot:365545-Chlamydomonas_euryale.AAC.9
MARVAKRGHTSAPCTVHTDSSQCGSRLPTSRPAWPNEATRAHPAPFTLTAVWISPAHLIAHVAKRGHTSAPRTVHTDSSVDLACPPHGPRGQSRVMRRPHTGRHAFGAVAAPAKDAFVALVAQHGMTGPL